jgi:hypothetical protein
MKKVLFAFITVLALCGTAEARSRYSGNHVTEEPDFISSLLGGNDWAVSPQPRYKSKRQARAYQQEQEDNWGFGHASNSLVALGYDLQHRGFRVSEHPSFGGVHHVHHGWAHYAGRAIDINVGRGVVEAHSGHAHRFDQLASELRSEGYTVLWRVAGHYNHMHVQR